VSVPLNVLPLQFADFSATDTVILKEIIMQNVNSFTKKQLEAFEVWIWRRMLKISYNDKVIGRRQTEGLI